MPQAVLIQDSFIGGALNESSHGQINSDIYRTGVSEVFNLDIDAQGSMTKRNGINYLWSSNDSDLTSVRWIPYRISDGRTLAFLVTPTQLIAFLNGRLTVDTQGRSPGRVDTEGWTEHTQRNPQTNIRYVQIGDSLYLVRPTHPTVRLQIGFNPDGQIILNWSKVQFLPEREPRLTSALKAFANTPQILAISNDSTKTLITGNPNATEGNQVAIGKNLSSFNKTIINITYARERVILLTGTNLNNLELYQITTIKRDNQITKIKDIDASFGYADSPTEERNKQLTSVPTNANSNIFFWRDRLYLRVNTKLWKMDYRNPNPTEGEFLRTLPLSGLDFYNPVSYTHLTLPTILLV